MKRNKLTIIIDRQVADVFDFTINPDNTDLWADGIVREEVNKFPIEAGVAYSNINSKGKWSKYVVSKYKRDKLFELKKHGSSYKVRYEYESVSKDRTRLTYIEEVDSGQLEGPFTNKTMQKLKRCIERKPRVLFKLESKSAKEVSEPRAWQLCCNAVKRCCWPGEGTAARMALHSPTGAAASCGALAGSKNGSK